MSRWLAFGWMQVYTPPVAFWAARIKIKKRRGWPVNASGVTSGKGEAK